MKWLGADHRFMSRALQLAERGRYSAHPNPRVGCVLVRDDKILAEAWHEYTGGPHAEVNAINQANQPVAGATCYVTLEPCSHSGRTPPCVDSLIRAHIAKVIAAMPDPNPLVAGQGLSKLEQAGIATAVGLLESEARAINRGYIKRMTRQRPFVRCKLAMSLDGRTALENGQSKWITGPQARMDVQRLRAQSSAVMTGIGTVLADDPALDVRESALTDRQPLRVIIDPQLKFPTDAKMLNCAGRSLVFTANRDKAAQAVVSDAGAEVIMMESTEAGFLQAVLQYLAEVEECNEILLEGGAKLAGSMLTAGLIDELILYQAAILMGDSAAGLFHLPALQTMDEKIELELIDTRHVGKDLRHTLKVKRKADTA